MGFYTYKLRKWHRKVPCTLWTGWFSPLEGYNLHGADNISICFGIFSSAYLDCAYILHSYILHHVCLYMEINVILSHRKINILWVYLFYSVVFILVMDDISEWSTPVSDQSPLLMHAVHRWFQQCAIDPSDVNEIQSLYNAVESIRQQNTQHTQTKQVWVGLFKKKIHVKTLKLLFVACPQVYD